MAGGSSVAMVTKGFELTDASNAPAKECFAWVNSNVVTVGMSLDMSALLNGKHTDGSVPNTNDFILYRQYNKYNTNSEQYYADKWSYGHCSYKNIIM